MKDLIDYFSLTNEQFALKFREIELWKVLLNAYLECFAYTLVIFIALAIPFSIWQSWYNRRNKSYLSFQYWEFSKRPVLKFLGRTSNKIYCLFLILFGGPLLVAAAVGVYWTFGYLIVHFFMEALQFIGL